MLEQEWRSGESARLPQMWPGFESGPGVRNWLRLLLVAPFSEGVSILISPGKKKKPKANTLNSNSIRREDPHVNQLKLIWPPSLNIVN